MNEADGCAKTEFVDVPMGGSFRMSGKTYRRISEQTATELGADSVQESRPIHFYPEERVELLPRDEMPRG